MREFIILSKQLRWHLETHCECKVNLDYLEQLVPKTLEKAQCGKKKERRSNKWDEASFKESFLESTFKHTVGEG